MKFGFNPLKIFRNSKVGLVLGSGGAKGMAHIGVIDHLEKTGIPIDMVAGSSIGALIGALYCSGALMDFRNDLVKKTKRDLMAYFDPVIPRSGLIEGRGYMKLITNYIPQKTMIEDLRIPLAVLATDYYTGNSVVFRSGNVHEALRASISIPGVFTPVRFKGTYLIDGGVANPLPVNVARRMGAGMTIAVNLHPTTEKRKWKNFVSSTVRSPGLTVDSREIEIIQPLPVPPVEPVPAGKKPASGLRGIFDHWMDPAKKAPAEQTPNIFEIIMQTIDIMEYVNTRMMLEYNTPTLLIEPDVYGAGMLDFSDSKRIIDEGVAACMRHERDIARKIRRWV